MCVQAGIRFLGGCIGGRRVGEARRLPPAKGGGLFKQGRGDDKQPPSPAVVRCLQGGTFLLVEMAGIEPASERIEPRISTSIVGC